MAGITISKSISFDTIEQKNTIKKRIESRDCGKSLNSHKAKSKKTGNIIIKRVDQLNGR